MMPENFIETMPDEAECQQKFRASCIRAGISPTAWPLSEADALKLLRDGPEMDATPATLARLETMGWYSPPDGDYSARDVTLLYETLDAFRFWKPSPSLHDSDPRRGALGVALSEAQQTGTVSEIVARLHDVGYDLRRALLSCVEQETRSARESMFQAISAMLIHRGVTF